VRNFISGAALGVCLSFAPIGSTSAQATCRNLTGHYVLQGEDGQVDLWLRQSRCDRVIVRHSSRYNGQPPDVSVDTLFLNGGRTAPGAKAKRARFVGDTLEVLQGGSATAPKAASRYKPTDHGDLCWWDPSGTIRASRLRSETRGERTTALNRSESGCKG
jgi:hypothetical protein